MEDNNINNENEVKQDLSIFNFYSNIKIPQYSERLSLGQKYVPFGDDNLYPNYYDNLYNKSSKHRAMIDTKTSMIAGNGISKIGLGPETINFIKNPKGETLDKIVWKMAHNIQKKGAVALKVFWSNDRKRIAKIEFIDCAKLRWQEPNDLQAIKIHSDGFYICEDWERQYLFGVHYLPRFNPLLKEIQPIQLYYWGEGDFMYGQPGYLAAVNWIELEYEISMFHLQSVKNGFAPSMVINFRSGRPTLQQMESETLRYRRQLEGAANAGKVLFLYSDADNGPEITPLTLNDSDQRYIALNESITEGILTGHRATNPNLFGIAVPGELGGRNQMVDGLEVFNAHYVIPAQRKIEEILNELGQYSGATEDIKLNQYVIKFKTEVNVEVLLTLLQSSITSSQKMIILMTSFGYSEDEAKKLIGE